MLSITHTRLNHVDLLQLAGDLDAATVPIFRQQIDTLFEQGRYQIVLDLAQLHLLSSAGMQVLAATRAQAREHQTTDQTPGDIRIANLSPYVQEVLDITGFTALFESYIYPDTGQAVASF